MSGGCRSNARLRSTSCISLDALGTRVQRRSLPRFLECRSRCNFASHTVPMLVGNSTSSTLDATAKKTRHAEELVAECMEGSEGERSNTCAGVTGRADGRYQGGLRA